MRVPKPGEIWQYVETSNSPFKPSRFCGLHVLVYRIRISPSSGAQVFYIPLGFPGDERSKERVQELNMDPGGLDPLTWDWANHLEIVSPKYD